MYSYTLLLALLPAVLGAPTAPQAAAATPIDSAAYSSLSSSISSSLATSMSSACKAKRSTSSTVSKASTSKSSSKSASKSASKSSSTTKSTSKSTSKSSTTSKTSSTTSRAISTSSIRPSSSSTQSGSSPPQGTATSWWKPTISNTFLYDADRIAIEAPTVTTSKGIKLTKDVYIIDMEGHTKAQIQSYKDKGKRVVCYISAGSWEPFRDDKLKFDPACYCGAGEGFNKSNGKCTSTKNMMGEWEEWWLDIKTPKCIANVQSVMKERIYAAFEKGCEGVDPDNVDAYANKVGYGVPYGITDKNQVDYLRWWSKTAHSYGMAIGLKNAGNLLAKGTVAQPYQQDLVAAFDFNVIEACTQYNECLIYDSMLKAQKPQIRVEYESRTKKCPAKVKGVTFSVYSGEVLNTKDINLDCV